MCENANPENLIGVFEHPSGSMLIIRVGLIPDHENELLIPGSVDGINFHNLDTEGYQVSHPNYVLQDFVSSTGAPFEFPQSGRPSIPCVFEYLSVGTPPRSEHKARMIAYWSEFEANPRDDPELFVYDYIVTTQCLENTPSCPRPPVLLFKIT